MWTEFVPQSWHGLCGRGTFTGRVGTFFAELGLLGVIDSGLVGSTGMGTARAEDAQGKPTQSHISPNILVYED